MRVENQIRRLRAAARELESSLEPVEDERLLARLGSWSPRDIVAHLVGWNRAVIRGSRQLLGGELPFYDEDPGYDYSKVNARFVVETASKEKRELMSELRTSLDELAAFLEALDPDDWQRLTNVVHRQERLSVRATVDELIEDYFHHSRQIREWVATDEDAVREA
jgi:hypothetical protein